jgi:hypothetical protein
MARSRPAANRAIAPSSPHGPRLDRTAALLATLIAGAFVFRGALGYFFTQDDFAGLARAAGLLPRLSGPWRYLSGQVYFDLMRSLAGLDPWPYHAASLLAHLGCVALLFTLLVRRFAVPAALVGTTFFAVHPALFTALYSISGIGEILALLFGLAALLAADASGPRRWLAVPLFALSLLAKESTLLLPLGLVLLRPRAGAAPGPRATAAVRPALDPLVGALAALALAYLGYFTLSDTFGIRTTLPEGAPYVLGFGAHLVWNFLSYVGWTWNVSILTVTGFTDAADPRVYPYALVALILWLAGGWSRTLRARGWLRGGALYLLLLLPVLPLRNHTYHYYLFAPLVGAAWCIAGLVDAVLAGTAGRRRALDPRPGWTAAVGLSLLLALNATLLVRKCETQPFLHPDMRADPTVDRARIARNVFEGLKRAELAPGTRLWFWSPPVEPEREARYWEQNLRSALMDGLGVRVLVPEVQAVEFVAAFRPVPAADRYAVVARDGRLRVATSAELDSLLRLQAQGR